MEAFEGIRLTNSPLSAILTMNFLGADGMGCLATGTAILQPLTIGQIGLDATTLNALNATNNSYQVNIVGTLTVGSSGDYSFQVPAADGAILALSGGALSGTQLVINEPSLGGDANLDGWVDNTDFADWRNHVGQDFMTHPGNHWTEGDFNNDQFVDNTDFANWQNNVGNTTFARLINNTDLQGAAPATIHLDANTAYDFSFSWFLYAGNDDGLAVQPSLQLSWAGAVGGQYYNINTSAPPAVSPISIAATAGSTYTQPLATFTSSVPGSVAADYLIGVNWGDGSTPDSSTGTDPAHAVTVSGNATAGFTVSGNHVFAPSSSPANATVTVTHIASGFHGSASVPVAVANSVSISGGSAVDEGTEYSLALSSANSAAAINSWQINWGDGQTDTLSGNPSTSQHKYERGGGAYTISASATDGTSALNALPLVVNVRDASVAGQAADVTGQAGQELSNISVATFADGNQQALPSDFKANVDWGDGTVPSGGRIIAGTAGHFTVSATHAYERAGSYDVTITIDDEGGSAITISSQANITAIPSGAVISNGTLQLGINSAGELNFGGVGLVYLPTGNESTALGIPAEGWGAADATTGITGYVNQGEGSSSNINVVSFTSTAATAISVVDVGTAIQVTQDYHPTQDPNVYAVSVAIVNTSDASIDLRYRRVVDWDVPPSQYHEYVTLKGSSPYLAYSNDDGFATADPLGAKTSGAIDPGYFAEGVFDTVGPADLGALMDLSFGSLAPQAVQTFTYFYGAGSGRAAAAAAISGAGAEVYSLAQPTISDGSGPASPAAAAIQSDSPFPSGTAVPLSSSDEQPADGPNVFLSGFKSGPKVAAKLDVLTNEGTPLDDTSKHTTGGYLAVNDSNDGYQFDSRGNPIPDYLQSGPIATEHDLLPLVMHGTGAEVGGRYTLSFNSADTQIFLNSDRSIGSDADGNPVDAVVSDQTEFDATQNTVVYVEGERVSPLAAADEVTLNWLLPGDIPTSSASPAAAAPAATMPAVKIDYTKLTVDDLMGPQNVPSYSRYSYKVNLAPGSRLPASTPPWSAQGGTVLSQQENDPLDPAVVLWDQGPNDPKAGWVGTVIFKPDPKFSLSRDVNVVQVSFSATASLHAAVVGMPAQSDGPGTSKIYSGTVAAPNDRNERVAVFLDGNGDGTFQIQPGGDDALLVSVMGPIFNGRQRGVREIMMGFTQQAVMNAKNAEFAAPTGVKRVTSSTQDGSLHWDGSVWSRIGTRIFHGTSILEGVAGSIDRPFYWSDEPELLGSDRMSLNGVPVSRFNLVMANDTYFAVGTDDRGVLAEDTAPGAAPNTVQTQRLSLSWMFNGSGQVADGKWTADQNSGTTVQESSFAVITNGVRVPRALPDLNDLWANDHWTVS